jgi:LysM repeat protein
MTPSAPQAAPTSQVYVVKKGDTLSKIAEHFGVTLQALRAANPEIKNPNKPAIGDKLVIPVRSSDAPAASA